MTVPLWLQNEWVEDLLARQAGDWDEVERLAEHARSDTGHGQRSMTWWPHRPTAAPYWATVARCSEDESTTGMAWPTSADHTMRAQHEQLRWPRVPL